MSLPGPPSSLSLPGPPQQVAASGGSPEMGDEAVADTVAVADVLGIGPQARLFRSDPHDLEGDHRQQEGGIPWSWVLEHVADIRDEVAHVQRVANEAVRPGGADPAVGRDQAERAAERAQA